MKRGNKVRYKKHLEFLKNDRDSNEEIISYESPIGIVKYDTSTIEKYFGLELTPMNLKHLYWALGRAKNKTKQNGVNSPWTIVL